MKINEHAGDKLELSYSSGDGSKKMILVENLVLTERPSKGAPIEKMMQWDLSVPFHPKKPQCPTYNEKLTSIYQYLDQDKNSLESIQVYKNIDKKIWWKHSSCGHSYKLSVTNRFSYEPACTLCLYLKKTDYQFISINWDESKNGKLTYLPDFDQKINWKCPNCNIESRKTIQNFYINQSCPNCKKIQKRKESDKKKEAIKEHKKFQSSSLKEREIFYLMTLIFGEQVINRYRLNKIEIDVFIPEYNIAIEYDGFYYHKGCEKRDMDKNNKLLQYGVNLIRIRENGLDRIKPGDIIFNLHSGGIKKLIIELCSIIKSNYNLSNEQILKMDDFLQGDINNIHLPENLLNPVLLEDSFAYNFKEITKYFHPDFNTEFKLNQISKRANAINKYMWWKCPACNFEWREPAVNIIRRNYICHRCQLNLYKHLVC